MRKKSVSNDKHVVEEVISDLAKYKDNLVIKDKNQDAEYLQGVAEALYCIRELIDDKIDYLQEVLSWYKNEPKTSGTFEVIDRYETLIESIMNLAKSQDETRFGKGMKDTYQEHLCWIAGNLRWIDDDNEKALEAYLYLSEEGNVYAMCSAAWMWENRQQYKKAQALFEKAERAGSCSAAESLMEMVYYGYIAESDLKKDYGFPKRNCVICGDEIYDIPYIPCRICGWAYTSADECDMKAWEKDSFNLMSRRKAKKLYSQGLTKWKEPIPDYKG